MITADEIARLRELMAKVAPAPWKLMENMYGGKEELWGYFHGIKDVCADFSGREISEDAAFIAAMRNALPALLEAAENAQSREAYIKGQWSEALSKLDASQKAYEQHLAGCAIEREELLSIGLWDSSCGDEAGCWVNKRADMLQAKLDAVSGENRELKNKLGIP